VGANLLPLSTSGGSSEHPTTPKVGASYDLTHGLVYATIAEGHRIGGANQLLPNICTAQLESLGVKGSAPPYTSDKVVSYELGVKNRFDVQGIFIPFKGVEISTTLSYTKAYYTESVSVPGDAGLLLTRNGDMTRSAPYRCARELLVSR